MNILLIVEPEAAERQKLRNMVGRSGVPIEYLIECKSGEEAEEIVKEQIVDVMITGMELPGMDGVRLVQKIKDCHHVPAVIAVGERTDFVCAVELLRAGVREYLMKPVETERLTRKLWEIEGELLEELKQKSQVLRIGYRQLRYLMLHPELPEEEQKEIYQQFASQFFEGKYRIACTNYRGEPETGFPGVIGMNGLEGQTVFLVESQKKEMFERQQLKNYRVGWSLEHQGIQTLTRAYEEASRARKQAYMLCRSSIVYEERENETGEIRKEDLERIVRLLGTERLNEAVRLVEQIQFEARKGQVSPEDFQEKTIMLLDRIGQNYSWAAGEDTTGEELRDIFHYDDIGQFRETMTGWLQQYHNQLMGQLGDYQNKKKMLQAVEYIRERYATDLNMAEVSNYVSMNYSLFSYEFKQYTGDNFVTYLKMLRLGEAKRLLSESDLRIAEISRKVGYENEKHFMKTFKNTLGISPTEYRKTHSL